MSAERTNNWMFLVGAFFIALLSYFIWKDQLYFAALPVVLLAIYAAIFHTQFTFLLLFLLTPLSVNIEEYVNGFGLFVIPQKHKKRLKKLHITCRGTAV